MAPESIEELQAVLLTASTGISQVLMDRLCSSFERRWQLCLEMGGQAIGHLLTVCGHDEVEGMWNSWTGNIHPSTL
jgi:hypothetical protein